MIMCFMENAGVFDLREELAIDIGFFVAVNFIEAFFMNQAQEHSGKALI